MNAEDIQSIINTLQARAEHCLTNGERQFASELLEAAQALRKLSPEAVAAPQPPPQPVAAPAPSQEAEAGPGLPEGV